MNDYSKKSYAELCYIKSDAYEAAQCAQANGDYVAECKYLDQLNDACTEMYKRKQKGL